MQLLDDLAFRNLAYQQTDADGLRAHLASPRRLYAGFDPTASSLTIGNLVPLLMLLRFQRAGHSPVVVAGGGTGLIGDPSGKSAERPVMTREHVEQNVEGQTRIYRQILDFSGSNAAVIRNNADWLTQVGFIEMLRDTGKHFSVNMMIQKDSVKERLNNREQGISYTEFSYMLLQAYDYLHLYRTDGVTLQIAGSDQWGNIVAGVDLIRRTERAEAFGLTAPLVTKSDGGKFGKTETGAIWLTRDRTSPYAFYQFWLNAADSDVPAFLKIFTLFERPQLEELLAEHSANPGARNAHRALARHVTELLHGPTGLAEAEVATAALFTGDIAQLPKQTLLELFENAPSVSLDKTALEGAGKPVIDLLVDASVVKSKREARELLSSNSILINGRKAALEDLVTTEWLLHGEVLAVRRGKKTWHIVRF